MAQRYFTRRRARFQSGGKLVNIPWGTALECRDGRLIWKGKPLCREGAQNALDYFVQDDDGCGRVRGELVSAVLLKLERQDGGYQARWNKVWEDPVCQKYRRTDHAEHWLWDRSFYNAPVLDLRYIAALVGA